MILSKFFSKKLARKTSPERAIYEAIVAAARRPVLYEAYAVPDTVDGRFDMIVLHLFVVLEKLGRDGQSQTQHSLAEEFFRDMDRSLREMGVGDLSVGKKVRKMAEAYQGRITAYRKAVADGAPAFAAALERNVYAGDGAGKATELADFVLRWREAVLAMPADNLAGNLEAA